MRMAKKTINVFAVVAIVLLVVKTVFYWHVGFVKYYEVEGSLRWLAILLDGLQFECMALGGVGAWLVYTGKKGLLKFLYRTEVQIINLAAICVCLYLVLNFRMFDGLVYGLMFAILIVNVSTNPASVLKLEGDWLSFLGKISYGMYVYHMTVLIIVINILMGMKLSLWSFNIALYTVTTIGTVAAAAVSYYLYEKRFLDLRANYSVVKNRSW